MEQQMKDSWWLAQFLTLFDPADNESLTKLWHRLRRMRPRGRSRFRWEEEEWLRASYRHLKQKERGRLQSYYTCRDNLI